MSFILAKTVLYLYYNNRTFIIYLGNSLYRLFYKVEEKRTFTVIRSVYFTYWVLFENVICFCFSIPAHNVDLKVLT